MKRIKIYTNYDYMEGDFAKKHPRVIRKAIIEHLMDIQIPKSKMLYITDRTGKHLSRLVDRKGVHMTPESFRRWLSQFFVFYHHVQKVQGRNESKVPVSDKVVKGLIQDPDPDIFIRLP